MKLPQFKISFLRRGEQHHLNEYSEKEDKPVTEIKPTKSKVTRKLNKKRLVMLSSIILVLIAAVFFISKTDFISLTIKGEELPACIDDCSFEGKLCENAKIYECVAAEDGCKDKAVTEECKSGDECSSINEGECYTPMLCDGDFHKCDTVFSNRYITQV
ncbi:MAG: hypothetical protein KKA79_05195 [Nanoarchaeota archaeon]|nr:hypothetical protein [Nanoarchaeota archaeon]